MLDVLVRVEVIVLTVDFLMFREKFPALRQVAGQDNLPNGASENTQPLTISVGYGWHAACSNWRTIERCTTVFSLSWPFWQL